MELLTSNDLIVSIPFIQKNRIEVDYMIEMDLNSLSKILTNPEVCDLKKTYECELKITKFIINKCKTKYRCIKYLILNITGPNYESINKFNRLVEEIFTDYGKRIPISSNLKKMNFINELGQLVNNDDDNYDDDTLLCKIDLCINSAIINNETLEVDYSNYFEIYSNSIFPKFVYVDNINLEKICSSKFCLNFIATIKFFEKENESTIDLFDIKQSLSNPDVDCNSIHKTEDLDGCCLNNTNNTFNDVFCLENLINNFLNLDRSNTIMVDDSKTKLFNSKISLGLFDDGNHISNQLLEMNYYGPFMKLCLVEIQNQLDFQQIGKSRQSYKEDVKLTMNVRGNLYVKTVKKCNTSEMVMSDFELFDLKIVAPDEFVDKIDYNDVISKFNNEIHSFDILNYASLNQTIENDCFVNNEAGKFDSQYKNKYFKNKTIFNELLDMGNLDKDTAQSVIIKENCENLKIISKMNEIDVNRTEVLSIISKLVLNKDSKNSKMKTKHSESFFTEICNKFVRMFANIKTLFRKNKSKSKDISPVI